VGLIQSVQTLNGEVLLAVNRAGTLLRFTTLSFVGSVVAFFVGVQWGVVGVAAAYAVATVLIEPVRTWSTTRAAGIPLLTFFSALFGIAQATAVMGVVVFASRSLMISAGISTGMRLALLVAIGCATYVPCCLWRAPEVRNEIQRVIGRSRRSASPRVEVRDSRVLEY
jgi:lipopolysaccharide exporter